MKDVLYNDITECILETVFKNKIKFSHSMKLKHLEALNFLLFIFGRMTLYFALIIMKSMFLYKNVELFYEIYCHVVVEQF